MGEVKPRPPSKMRQSTNAMRIDVEQRHLIAPEHDAAGDQSGGEA